MLIDSLWYKHMQSHYHPQNNKHKHIFHYVSSCVLPPCGEPPAVMQGTQFPWCIMQDHGHTLEPGSRRVSVRWQTSIISKFCRKSDTDILMEREAGKLTGQSAHVIDLSKVVGHAP